VTWPLDTVPLRKAVVHALTQPTGKFRAIAQEFLFAEARGPTVQALNVADLKNRPQVWVAVRDRTSEVGTNEGSDERRIRCTVSIAAYYYSGSESHRTESKKYLDRVDSDGMRLLAALTYPGSLELDPEGNEVGLDGASLRGANSGEYRSIGPDLIQAGPDGPRIYRVTHQLLGTLTLAQPAT